MAKDLVLILFSCVAWPPLLTKQSVLVQCDNLSLVEALAKGSSRDTEVMRLLRCLWFYVAFYDIELQTTHITGSLNCTADHLSRNNMQSFFSLHPTGIPPASSSPPVIAADSGLTRAGLDIPSLHRSVQRYY